MSDGDKGFGLFNKSPKNNQTKSALFVKQYAFISLKF